MERGVYLQVENAESKIQGKHAVKKHKLKIVIALKAAHKTHLVGIGK